MASGRRPLADESLKSVEADAALKNVLLITACPVRSNGVERCFGGIQRWTQIVAKHGLPGIRLRFVNTTIKNMSRFRGASAWRGEAGRIARILASICRHVGRGVDLIHINSVPTTRGFAATEIYTRLARLWGRPVVIHHHGDVSSSPERYQAEHFPGLRRLARRAEGHIVLNRQSLDAVEQFGGHAFLLPNFIEDSFLQRRNGKREEMSGRVRIVFAGQISKDKGCVELLEASRQLPDADFVLLGNVHKDMEERVRDLPANVEIVDQVPQEAVEEEMRTSDIFVLPSLREGFPMAALEAMAVGLPVVTTRAGALPDMIEEGKGGVIVPRPRGDPVPLISALRALLGDPARRRRMGRFNRERVRTEYAYSVVAPQLTSIYEQIASATRPRT